MKFKEAIHNQKASLLSFYLYYILYIINDLILKNKKSEQFLWDLIKCELFYISGSCIHTANCCKHMNLIINGKKITSLPKFNKLKENNTSYKKFIPNISKNIIIDFSCKWLTTDNKCKNYNNRPDFCRNFPLSNFILNEKINPNCGYKIKKTSINPKIRNPSIKKRIRALDCAL